MKKEIQIQYGVFGDTIEEQLKVQGCTLGDKQELVEKLQHALTMCRFHLLTDSQYNAGLKKLHKKVMDSVRPLEE